VRERYYFEAFGRDGDFLASGIHEAENIEQAKATLRQDVAFMCEVKPNWIVLNIGTKANMEANAFFFAEGESESSSPAPSRVAPATRAGAGGLS